MAKVISNFKILKGEANFAPPISREVRGGTHISAEVIPFDGQFLYAKYWPNGLARHDDGPTMRFVHGHVIFGETMLDCAKRLLSEQFNLTANNCKVIDIESYVDESDHWHIEPIILASINEPNAPILDKLIRFEINEIPDLTFWKASELKILLSPWLR